MVQCIANRGKKMTGQDRIGSSVRFLGFPGDSLVKNPPANARDVGSILGGEDALEEGMATHSNILAWKIPWTGEPGRLQSMWSQRGPKELDTFF